jgi:hypothetical protein
MERNKFKEEQVAMLKNGFSEAQIKDNVYREIFYIGIPNIRIEALIFTCMEVYSDIIIQFKNK